MNIKHPATITQFRYIPLVLGYIARASGKISFAEIQTNLIRKNYEIQARNYDYSLESGDNPLPPSRHGEGRPTDMYQQLRQILSELMLFGLIEVTDEQNNKLNEVSPQKPIGDISEYWMCHLTSYGAEMWQLAKDPDRPLEFEARYFTLMFNHFSIVGKFLRAVYNGGKNSIIIPHVTAQELGLEDLDIERPEGLRVYLDKVTESVLETYYTYTKSPNLEVDDDFRLYHRPELEEKVLKTIQDYRQRGEKYARFLIIARIRDSCVSYFAHKLTGVKSISGRSLEALSSRLSKMEMMGYSDYILRRGRIVFLCSWLVPFLDTLNENQLAGHKKFDVELCNPELQIPAHYEQLIFHQPEYYLIKDRFEESLDKNFRQLYRSQRQQFVSIPDIRENVCLDLKISAKSFDRLMVQAYNESFSGKSALEITLSNERSYVEYGLERWHRAPLSLKGNQMTVVRIKRRTV